MSSALGHRLSAYDIRREGWRALTERLGIGGAIRFLAQYDPGHGAYTVERRVLFQDDSLDELLAEMKSPAKRRAARNSIKKTRRR